MGIERKNEATRARILGSLVLRAGLGRADRAFLLGALLEIAEIEKGSPAYRRIRERGAEAFGVGFKQNHFHCGGKDA